MRRVLATDFGIWPMVQNMGQPSEMMYQTPAFWARLANYLLMYDQIIIPTGNFQIIAVLRLMLGEDIFDEFLRNRTIVLARYDQWMCYVGNGGGLLTFAVGDDPLAKRGANLATSFFKPLDEAIDVALVATNPPSNAERRKEIKNLLTDQVVILPTQAISAGLKDEVYRDVLGSPLLRDFLSIRNAGRSLDHLIGINPDQVRIFSPHVAPEPGDSREIRAVLRVAFENFVLSIGGHVEATEIIGDDSTFSVLQAKGQRIGLPVRGDGAFAKIQEISGVPDIGNAFATRQLSARQLLDLRESRHSVAFRKWLDSGSPSETADETIGRYMDAAGPTSWIDALPVKLLRFATTTSWGAVEPISGAIASGVDSFLLSKWFPSRSPRLFMKQAKAVLQRTPVVKPPVLKGRDRNRPCSCGSGKKFKACCGR